MTAADPTLGLVKEDTLQAGRWHSLERRLEAASEYLNPILVKEARQALKSKQFAITFTLLLVLGWCWSLLGVSLGIPTIYYAAMGPFMLSGYYFVLAVPLLVVVPFTAFRSLAAEREDGTYELLSITTLSSRQVVTGKLGTAVLQMLVYYSALSPCIAFTYLLRGVDILSILLMLFWTFLFSVMLSAAAMLLATLTQARHWQVLMSVVLIIVLAVGGFIWSMIMVQMIAFGEMMPYDQVDAWIGQLAVITFYLSFLVLLIASASANLSFASDNRSTRLRVIMLAQQTLAVGWFLYYFVSMESEGWLFALALLCGAAWTIYGALLIGERAQLSPRERRALPQSWMGRMCLTWFNPGSGTGYIFAVANLAAVVFCVVAAGNLAQLSGFEGTPTSDAYMVVALLVLFYATAYLGMARLLFLLVRRYAPAGILFSSLFTLLLVVLGAALPPLAQSAIVGFSNLEYSLGQVPNWIWTLVEAGASSSFALEIVVTVGIGAAGLLLLNLVLAAREVEQVRLETPQRVQEDDQQGQPVDRAAAKPTNPWDDQQLATAEGS